MSPRGEGVLEPELGGLREELGSRWEGGAASAAETVRAGFPDRSITPAFHLLSTEFRPGSRPKQNAALSPMGGGGSSRDRKLTDFRDFNTLLPEDSSSPPFEYTKELSYWLTFLFLVFFVWLRFR